MSRAAVASWIEALHSSPRPSDDVARELVEASKRLDDVIRLNTGDPDRIAPPNVLEAGAAALLRGETHYVLGPGLPALRQAIADKHARENGFEADPDTQLSITNGSFEAIATLMRTILDAGDEVVTTDPYYGGHVTAIRYARGVPVLLPTSPDRRWEIDPGEIAKRIGPRTRAIIFATPGNPSGAVMGREVLAEICRLAQKHALWVISDELFERYVYDGAEHTSTAALPEAGERVITVHGFSKSYCMTGWRIGWLVGPPRFMRHFQKLRYAASMCTNTFAQHGAVEALSSESNDYYLGVKRDYGRRREAFFRIWEEVGLPQRPGPGAFVTLVDIRPTGRSSAEMAGLFLRRAGTLLWPGTQFGEQAEGFLRVGLVVPEDRLCEFGERLKSMIRDGRILA